MFSFFRRETHPDLEKILLRLRLNAENNYRDATKEDLGELSTRYEELKSAGKLNDKQKARYSDLLATYSERMKKFTHKDQTPYWTK